MNIIIKPIQLNQVVFLGEIESDSQEQLWSTRDFKRHLMKSNCGGYTAIIDGHIVGFICCEYFANSNKMLIWNLVISKKWRNSGVGKKLLQTFIEIHEGFADSIHCHVRESNLEAQMYLKRMGFTAWAIIEDYFVDPTKRGEITEAAYCFKYGGATKPFSTYENLGKCFKRDKPSEKTKRLAKRAMNYDRD